MDDDRRKRPSSSQIATASSECRMEELPRFLVMNILSRLPIKTILNCRCTCKIWLHYISDSNFATLHLERSPTFLLNKNSSKDPESINFPIAQISGKPFGVVDRMKFAPGINLPNDHFIIENSCNGLICLCDQISQDKPLDEIYVHVCNPILGEFISILPAGSQETRIEDYFSLGFSAFSKKYKVLHTFYLRSGLDVQPKAEIYTIGTGQWRSIQEALLRPDAPSFDTFVRGSIHWVLRDQDNHANGIGSFNFDSEQFSQLSLPPQLDAYRVSVIVFYGSLGVSLFDVVSKQFQIWVMKKYGIKESWTKQFTIRKDDFVKGFYIPLIFFKNGLILMLHVGHRFIFYDTQRNLMEDIRIFQTRRINYVTAYKPSFVSLMDVVKGEELKMLRTRASGKDHKSSSEGTSKCTSLDQLSKSISPETN